MIKMIFDATILLNMSKKDSGRSGIFFCVKNIYEEFRTNEDVHLVLYYSPERIMEAPGFHESFAKDLPCVNIFPQHSILLAFNKFFWTIHRKLYRFNHLRLPFALGILLSQKTIKCFYKDKYKEDIVRESQIFFSPAKEIAKSLKSYTHLKYFTILHDAIPLISSYMGKEETRNHRRLISSFGERDFFFPNSLQTKRDFEKFTSVVNNDSAFVVPHAASPDIIQETDADKIGLVLKKYHIPSGKKYVFSLCTLEPRKNLFRAVETFCQFVKKNKINDLVWVLGGGHWDAFFKEMKKRNIQWDPNLIIQTGYIDDEDRSSLYSGAEWFVYTSQYEGFGVPPLEAMQCGCPVITSNNSSLPEVVGDAAITIDWDSDEQHISAYEKYYFNKALCQEYGAKGLQRSKMFSWKKTADKMIRIMEGKF